ncbi:MAG: glycoside hydrolase family 95 protein [Tepidisphaeraceae bacterium]
MTTLWYRRPAETWNEALPIGNGRIGGMVFGGVHEERIGLNDDTLWSGAPQDGTNPGGPRTLKEVRDFLAAGEFGRADEMSKRMMGPYTQSYLALGDLNLKFEGLGEISDYRQELDLTTGIARTEFVADGTRFTREVFVSNPDQVLVVRLTADGPARLNVMAELNSLLPFKTHGDRGELVLAGKAPSLVDPTYYRRGKINFEPDGEGMRFAVRLLAHECDGAITLTSESIRVENASRVTLLLTAATSFDRFWLSPTRPGKPEQVIAATQIDLAVRKPYETLRATHVADHGRLFNRMSFSLNAKDDRPTDEMLTSPTPESRKKLSELLFHFGRYLLIACSRPGDQPANLQGIWNGEMRAPWSGNFTININTQMNYWPAEPANLAECHRPMLDFIRELALTGKAIARTNYNCEGWCAHHNSDLWRNAAPVGDSGAPPPTRSGRSGRWAASGCVSIFGSTTRSVATNAICVSTLIPC